MCEYLRKTYSKLLRIYIKHSTNLYPTSFPYITGDGFRSLAKHIYDESSTVNPELVADDDIVFVNSNLLEKYFDVVHPFIKNKYKLISHNSDKNITDKELHFIDNKILHWYAQNVTVYHEKLTPIPIGIENKRIAWAGIPFILNYFKSLNRTKRDRILVAFNISTNKIEREKALNELKNNSLADIKMHSGNYIKYLNKLITHRFVASPPGNGIDCHRTWEALYLGVIPVVRSSICTEYFKKLGLPIIIADDWSRQDILVGLDKQNLEALKFDFWRKKIYEKNN